MVSTKCDDPHVPRKLEQCHDVEANPGPRNSSLVGSAASTSSGGGGGGAPVGRTRKEPRAGRRSVTGGGNTDEEGRPATSDETVRVQRIEQELISLQALLTTLDSSVNELKSSLDSMRPAYQQALQVLANERASQGNVSRNSLVFHGVEPDPLEIQMEGDPEFCRDALETRIKMIFREHLRISRDMPFTHIHRIEQPQYGGLGKARKGREAPKPLVVGFKSLKDKDNILTHTNLLRKEGIYVTEDTTGKRALIPRSPIKKRNANNKNNSQKQENLMGDLLISDHMSSCNSDYAPSSHSGNSSSSVYTD